MNLVPLNPKTTESDGKAKSIFQTSGAGPKQNPPELVLATAGLAAKLRGSLLNFYVTHL
jgi:hypothetical protein